MVELGSQRDTAIRGARTRAIRGARTARRLVQESIDESIPRIRDTYGEAEGRLNAIFGDYDRARQGLQNAPGRSAADDLAQLGPGTEAIVQAALADQQGARLRAGSQGRVAERSAGSPLRRGAFQM